MSKIVCVQIFADETEARIAQGMLEANGIEADIFTDNCGGVHPEFKNMSGTRLMVRNEDKKKAKELLKNIE